MSGRWIRRGASDTAIVFVHGINSDEDAFRSETAFWPELLAEESGFADIGIFVFEYRTKITAPGFTLGDAVDYMKEIIRLEIISELKQIIFVCHSMGGNLVRRYIVTNAVEYARRQTKFGLFLIACPSTGSHYANLFRMIRRNYHMQLESLVASQKNVWLNDLDRDFKNLLHESPFTIVGRELVEDLPIVGRLLLPRTQVVPPHSATRYFGEPLKVPGSDHFTISAPRGSDDLQHRVLVDWIRRNFSISAYGNEANIDEVAKEFLQIVDEYNYKRAWELLDIVAKETLIANYSEFEIIFRFREELGEVISRKFVGSSQVTDPPGYARGIYKLLQYSGRYKDGGLRVEQLALRRAWSGSWKPFSYTISVMPIPGDFSSQPH